MTEETLNYEDLNFPTVINASNAMNLTVYNSKGKPRKLVLPFLDVPKAAVLGGIAFLNIGGTRCGKSQLMMDIHRHYFGGDADQDGKSTWEVARNNFTADSFFSTINQDKVGEGKGMLSEAKVSVKKRVDALCNIVDEVNLTLPEIQVEFFSMAEGRHNALELGQEGYHLFMASCNVNRINGDYVGTSLINKALLNRFGLTLDFDYFEKLDADDDLLDSREAAGRLRLAPLRDISPKILGAYHKIMESANKRDPLLDAYTRIFSSGLKYCYKDPDNKKKRIWPSNCGKCDFMSASNDRRLCHLVMHANTGTKGIIKQFAKSIEYLVQLKHGEKCLDQFELALESFKFTTYHGNLNPLELLSTYNGEDQEHMNDVVARIREKIMPIRTYIDAAVDSAVSGNPETRFIRLREKSSGKVRGESIYSERVYEGLKEVDSKQERIVLEVFDPFNDNSPSITFEKRTGIRMNWFKGYLDSLVQDKSMKCD